MNLITGIKSGLGKYLYTHLPNCFGMHRNNEHDLHSGYDTIIHCAFNKQKEINDYTQYLDDNLLLTERLLNKQYQKFVYISSIDIYQDDTNNYCIFKRLAEEMVSKYENTLILRCSMMLGETMKSNHLTRIIANDTSLTLSSKSKFNYILMQDLNTFFDKKLYLKHTGIIDFVATEYIELEKVSELFNSKINFGNYVYTSDFAYSNPIYSIESNFNKTSLDNLKGYYNL